MALNFSSDQYGINVGSGTSLNNPTVMTCLAWVKPTNVAQDNKFILGKYKSSPDVFYNFAYGNADGFAGGIKVDISRATQSCSAFSTGAIVSNGTWQFLGFQFDINGSATDQKCLYGDLSTPIAEIGGYSIQRVGSGAHGDDSAGSAIIGQFSTDLFAWVDPADTIAFVGLWPSLLTLAQMRMQQRSLLPIIPGFVGFWHPGLYGASGTQPDWSGNGNNGTIVGSPALAAHVPLAWPQVPTYVPVTAAAGRTTKNTDAFPLGLHTAMGWRIGTP